MLQLLQPALPRLHLHFNTAVPAPHQYRRVGGSVPVQPRQGWEEGGEGMRGIVNVWWLSVTCSVHKGKTIEWRMRWRLTRTSAPTRVANRTWSDFSFSLQHKALNTPLNQLQLSILEALTSPIIPGSSYNLILRVNFQNKSTLTTIWRDTKYKCFRQLGLHILLLYKYVLI